MNIPEAHPEERRQPSLQLSGTSWKRLLLNGMRYVYALPVVVAVRLLRPVVLIRFAPVRDDRLGHFAPEPELCSEDGDPSAPLGNLPGAD